MMIDGQKRISDTFDAFTLSTLPHSVLLVGDEGCGKHLLCHEMAKKLNIPVEELEKDKFNFDYISEIVQRPYQSLYIVDLDNIDNKKQNVLLKFIEEPTVYMFVFLLTSSLSSVIDTVKGRCQTFKFDAYSDESLKKFSDDENALIYFRTPGQIKNNSEKLSETIALCKNITDNIVNASIGNVLVITDKLKLNKNDTDKIPVELFMRVLLNFQKNDYESYRLILQGGKDLRLNIDKKMYIDNMLIRLKFIKKKWN